MEYKFRGFDATGQKGWVYGDLVHNKKVTKTGLEDRVMVGGYEVVPESVSICTGLKDSKDRELWDGDILSCDTLIVYVKYITRKGAFELHRKSEPLWFLPIDCAVGGFEVIGNVFENQELLEKNG